MGKNKFKPLFWDDVTLYDNLSDEERSLDYHARIILPAIIHKVSQGCTIDEIKESFANIRTCVGISIARASLIDRLIEKEWLEHVRLRPLTTK